MRTSPYVSLVLVLGVLGGCRSAGAADWNLSQLHGPDGAYRRKAEVQGEFEYLMRSQFQGLLANSALGLNETIGTPNKERVDDPGGASFRNLRKLLSLDPDGIRTLALQAQWTSWLAVVEPWTLSRQVAAEGLGPVGRGLKVEAPLEPPAEVSEVEVTSEALRDFLLYIERTGGGEPAALEAALEPLDQLSLDVESGARILRAYNAVLGSQRGPGPESLARRRFELAQALVGQALWRSLRDPEPKVRAAAAKSAVQMGGSRALEALLGPDLVQEDALVQAQVLELLKRRGLAITPDRELMQRLVELAVFGPQEAVRTQAMLALGRVSGSGFSSLRREDWHTWWQSTGSVDPLAVTVR